MGRGIGGAGRPPASFLIGISVMVAGFAGLAALQYVTPSSPLLRGVFDQAGMADTSRWLFGRTFAPWGLDAYLWAFRALVLTVWAGYGTVVIGVLRSGRANARWGLAVGGVIAVALAVLFPPSLTHDPYAYLAFGRMGALHGWNPYTHALKELAALGDPAAVHYDASVPTVYGPAWTMVATALAWAGRTLPLAAQVVGLKLVQSLALLLAAVSARACARVWDPEHADLALIATALNPLLLLEGPANGHNDLLMMALLLAGTALVLRSRRSGWVLLGLSAGVKYVSLAIAPWLLVEEARRVAAERGTARAVARLAGEVALIATPLLLANAPYRIGAAGIRAVWDAGVASGGRGPLIGPLVVMVTYIAVTVWVLRGTRTRTAAGWTLWSAVAALFGLPLVLPWYGTWATATSTIEWRRGRWWVPVAFAVAGLGLMLSYTAT